MSPAEQRHHDVKLVRDLLAALMLEHVADCHEVEEGRRCPTGDSEALALDALDRLDTGEVTR